MNLTLNTFAERLIQEKGIAGLPIEVMNQLRDDLASRAEDLINAQVLAHMPEDKLEDFEKVLNEKDDEKIQAFCNENIKNLDEVVAAAMLKLKKIYLGETQSKDN